MDLAKDLFHFLLGFWGDDSRSAGVVAKLCRVRDTVAHVVQSTLVKQIDDQFQFVHAFEVGHFRLIAGFDQGFETCFDQLAHAAAQDDLFAEKIGLGFFGDCRFDDTTAGSADAFGVGQADLLGGFACAGTEGD